jgi:hypothetical protein
MLEKYFLGSAIETELVCLSCKTRYEIPKVLPCGYTICKSCELDLIIIKDTKKIECLFCNEEHELPKNGFPINKSIANMLGKSSLTVNRGDVHDATTKKICELKSISSNFMNDLNDPIEKIKTYCELQKSKIELKTESMKQYLEKYCDNLTNQINNFEKECLEKNQNQGKFDNFKRFIAKCDKQYETMSVFLNKPDIQDKDLKIKYKEASSLINDLENDKKAFESVVFNKRKLCFTENDFELEEKLFGECTFIPLIDFHYKRMKRDPLVLKINYKTESDSFNYKKVIPLEFNFGQFCFVAKINEYGKYLIKIKIFSPLGVFINEVQEESEKDEFIYAKIFRGNILIISKILSFEKCQSFYTHTIKLYDAHLKVVISQTNLKQSDILDVYTTNDKILICTISDSTYNLIVLDENFAMLSSTENVRSGIFSNNLAENQCFIKYNKIFSFSYKKLSIYNVENLELLETFRFEFPGCLFQVASEDRFIIIDQLNKIFKLLNFKNETLVQFAIKIDKIKSFFITENDHLALHDSEENTLNIVKD